LDSVGLLLFIQVILIALNAVFACAEIAVLSVSETKLDKLANEGNRKARRLRKLTAQPAKFLATIQVAITLSGFLGSAFAADNFSDRIVSWLVSLGVKIPVATLNTIAVIIITLILSYVTLIFGELVPKRIAMKRSEQLALGISGIIGGISVVFAPIVWLLSASTNVVLRLLGIDPNEAEEEVSEEEIRMLVDAGSEKGTIDHEEKEFIQNVFEFDDLTAGDVGTHRTDITVLWMEDDDAVWAKTIHESRFTLYPICDGSADNVVGILNSKEYFRQQDKSRENILAAAVKPAYFVPETIKADVLFRNMRTNGRQLAVVLDEYGGVEGIVTINDLVECLVGDLDGGEDEVSSDEPRVERIGDDMWRIYGNILLSDIEEETASDFSDTEFDTLTGFAFDVLGMIPDEGVQNIELELGGFLVNITRIEEHQIAECTIRKLVRESTDEEDD